MARYIPGETLLLRSGQEASSNPIPTLNDLGGSLQKKSPTQIFHEDQTCNTRERPSAIFVRLLMCNSETQVYIPRSLQS